MFYMKNIRFLALLLSFLALEGFAQVGPSTVDNYIIRRFPDKNGREITEVVVPGRPPLDYRAPVAPPTESSVMLSSVPAFSWSFGCSATSAAMAAGFYDNQGYPNMYTGPTNGGVMPMNNSSWGSVVINGETRDLCPLSATKLGLDGRTTNGHVDDYWILYGSSDPDPYITNGWTQHTHELCTGDYMGTNQSVLGNSDGSTSFVYYTDGTPLYDYTGGEPGYRDGCHGMRLFFESRGYTVVQNYTQLINGYDGNTLGFTFEQYKAEINSGRPVLIQVAGHTMLGFGYDDTGSTVYLHDTWDYSNHSMTWGGSYSGMEQWGVTVVQLMPVNSAPIANFSGSATSILTGASITFTDQSTGNPTGWQWSFPGGTPSSSTSQNPTVQYNTPGTYSVTLVATNAYGSDTELKTDYITISDPSYCTASGSCDEYISNVSVGSINNTSACSTNGYCNYTSISTSMQIGQSYPITIQNGNPVYPDDQCGLWIDWNHDLDFSDANENIAVSGTPGSGPYTAVITPPADAVTGIATRMRVRILYSGTVAPCGQAEWGETEDYTVTVTSGAVKTLNLTLYLEGLFNTSTSQMNKAQDENGNRYPGTVADEIDIALAQSSAPYSIVATAANVSLNCNGSCTASFSSSLSGNYYIVVTHRNSITTWSASPVSFAGSTINYNFSDLQSRAYGNNLILNGSKYCLYGGDVNQDGLIDSGDMIPLDNLSAAFGTGYLPEDVNGDGLIDSGDMIVVDNNAAAFVGGITP